MAKWHYVGGLDAYEIWSLPGPESPANIDFTLVNELPGDLDRVGVHVVVLPNTRVPQKLKDAWAPHLEKLAGFLEAAGFTELQLVAGTRGKSTGYTAKPHPKLHFTFLRPKLKKWLQDARIDVTAQMLAKARTDSEKRWALTYRGLLTPEELMLVEQRLHEAHQNPRRRRARRNPPLVEVKVWDNPDSVIRRFCLMQVGGVTVRRLPTDIPEGPPALRTHYTQDGYVEVIAEPNIFEFMKRAEYGPDRAWEPYLHALGEHLIAHYPSYQEQLTYGWLAVYMQVGPEVVNNLTAFAEPLEAFCKDWLTATMPRVTADLLHRSDRASQRLGQQYLSYFGPTELVKVDQLMESRR